MSCLTLSSFNKSIEVDSILGPCHNIYQLFYYFQQSQQKIFETCCFWLQDRHNSIICWPHSIKIKVKTARLFNKTCCKLQQLGFRGLTCRGQQPSLFSEQDLCKVTPQWLTEHCILSSGRILFEQIRHSI